VRYGRYNVVWLCACGSGGPRAERVSPPPDNPYSILTKTPRGEAAAPTGCRPAPIGGAGEKGDALLTTASFAGQNRLTGHYRPPVAAPSPGLAMAANRLTPTLAARRQKSA